MLRVRIRIIERISHSYPQPHRLITAHTQFQPIFYRLCEKNTWTDCITPYAGNLLLACRFDTASV